MLVQQLSLMDSSEPVYSHEVKPALISMIEFAGKLMELVKVKYTSTSTRSTAFGVVAAVSSISPSVPGSPG